MWRFVIWKFIPKKWGLWGIWLEMLHTDLSNYLIFMKDTQLDQRAVYVKSVIYQIYYYWYIISMWRLSPYSENWKVGKQIIKNEVLFHYNNNFVLLCFCVRGFNEKLLTWHITTKIHNWQLIVNVKGDLYSYPVQYWMWYWHDPMVAE